MKKIFLILTASVIFSSNCFALTFSQPVEIGSIFWTPSSGLIFKNESYNDGKVAGQWKENNKYVPTYRNGTARWGDERTGIYFIYKTDPPYFGGINKNFEVTVMVNTSINKIKNDGGISLYLIRNDGSGVSSTNYTVIGRRKDGIWVKYFDTKELKKKYFGSSRRIYLSDCTCIDDTIVINVEKMDRGRIKIGEFRFKWDDKAQWFGVEQIIY